MCHVLLAFVSCARIVQGKGGRREPRFVHVGTEPTTPHVELPLYLLT